MDPALTKIRAEIKQCEELIALCERIKQLEKLQDGRLEAKKRRLEEDIVELIKQKQLTSVQIQRFEESVNSRDRIVSAFEVSQVQEQLKTAHIRNGILTENIGNLSKEVERIDSDLYRNDSELQGLYAMLEQFMAEGFDPNTINDRLSELKTEKEKLTESVRSIRQGNQTENRFAADGTPVGEAQFIECLMIDLADAKKSIEVVSQQVNVNRASTLMNDLARFASEGKSVSLYTSPIEEQTQSAASQFQKFIVNAFKQRISLVQRSGLEYNAVIIDKRISWEGTVNVLGDSGPNATMKRMSTSAHIRELRYYLFDRVR
jgi:hypothetical protein